MDTPENNESESMMEGVLTDPEERKKKLQDLLREEMAMHIKEGRVGVERNQERVEHIRKLKEELHKEEKSQNDASNESPQSGQSCLAETSLQEWYRKVLEQRRKLKEDHERVILNELKQMETELQDEQREGLEGEVVYLNRERQVLVLQIEALHRENQQADIALETQYTLHQQEIHSLREESLQVFRTFRQVLEEQKRITESRYRTLLVEAIQDAVHLSSQNQQLQADNKQLRKAVAELEGLSDNIKLQE